MFVKFQHFDTCFHVYSSTKGTPPNVGVSVTPPFKKLVGHGRGKQHKHGSESSDGRKLQTKYGLGKYPNGGIEKNDGFGGGLSSKVSALNGVNGGGLLRKPDHGGIHGEGKVMNAEGSNKGEKRCMAEMKTQITCSTKWLRYGGCIPAMLKALESVSDLDEALKPWEASLTNKERSILLKEQMRWERAMEIFEWFKSKGCYEVNVIHYNIMIRILGKAGRWCEVERLWDEMGKRRIEPINSTYGTLIDVYSKGGRREEALKWLELMNERKMEPDEVTMGTVVQMYKKAGDFKTAEEFFKNWSFSMRVLEEHRSATLRIERGVNTDCTANTCLTSYTYNTLIDTYGKAGKLQEANETFQLMFKEKILPTTVTFNTMMHMYGNNGQLGEVASLMRKMEEVQCSPDNRTYNILISVHAKHGDIETSSVYLKRMKEASLEPDVVSYRTLLNAFSVRHMVPEAEELISEMDGRGLEIDEFTQSALTRMYIESGMLENALSWFQRFHVEGNMTSECYSANIDAFGERGHVLEAEKVFNCCQERRRLSVLEYNVMIKAYGINKGLDLACCTFDSMEKHGVMPDRCSYGSIIQMLASADQPHKASHYLRKMQEAGLVTDCIPYCAVISSYVKLYQLDKAVGLYDEMIGCGVEPDAILFGVLINAFAETGSVKEATYYVNAFKDTNLQMNDILCKSLIKLYTKVGYLKEAREIYETHQSFEAGLDLYTSNCMIDLYSERSMISEAEEIFKKLVQNGGANEFTYAMMLRMYKRNGRFVEALCIAQKMRELGLMSDLLSYNNVLGLYASDGRFKDAAATFNEMLKSNIQPNDSTFKALRIILLKRGVPTSAVDKLEHARKKDAQSGLQAWTSTLRSFVIL